MLVFTWFMLDIINLMWYHIIRFKVILFYSMTLLFSFIPSSYFEHLQQPFVLLASLIPSCSLVIFLLQSKFILGPCFGILSIWQLQCCICFVSCLDLFRFSIKLCLVFLETYTQFELEVSILLYVHWVASTRSDPLTDSDSDLQPLLFLQI